MSPCIAVLDQADRNSVVKDDVCEHPVADHRGVAGQPLHCNVCDRQCDRFTCHYESDRLGSRVETVEEDLQAQIEDLVQDLEQAEARLSARDAHVAGLSEKLARVSSALEAALEAVDEARRVATTLYRYVPAPSKVRLLESDEVPMPRWVRPAP